MKSELFKISATLLLLLVQLNSFLDAQSPPPNLPPNSAKDFGTKEDMADIDHIQHHLEGEVDVKNMQKDQLQKKFLYFKAHDLNNDLLIDGLELMKDLLHVVEVDNRFNLTEDRIERMVDANLLQADKDNDGFISWPEYYEMIKNITVGDPPPQK